MFIDVEFGNSFLHEMCHHSFLCLNVCLSAHIHSPSSFISPSMFYLYFQEVSALLWSNHVTDIHSFTNWRWLRTYLFEILRHSACSVCACFLHVLLLQPEDIRRNKVCFDASWRFYTFLDIFSHLYSVLAWMDDLLDNRTKSFCFHSNFL